VRVPLPPERQSMCRCTKTSTRLCAPSAKHPHAQYLPAPEAIGQSKPLSRLVLTLHAPRRCVLRQADADGSASAVVAATLEETVAADASESSRVRYDREVHELGTRSVRTCCFLRPTLRDRAGARHGAQQRRRPVLLLKRQQATAALEPRAHMRPGYPQHRSGRGAPSVTLCQ
jgi:hypothetical protein